MNRRGSEGGQRRLLCSLLVLAGALGCTSGGNELSGTTSALPACGYAAGLGTLDAPVSGACTAARVALSCEASNGSGQFCLSNVVGQCPNPASPPPGATSPSCTDQCNAGEYGVSCGVGFSAGPSPPDGCRTALASPGGAIYCCPCG